MPKMTGNGARLLRVKLGMNQIDFWRRVGMTQSAGSRYESGSRELPAPVQSLLLIAYGSTKEFDAEILRLRPVVAPTSSANGRNNQGGQAMSMVTKKAPAKKPAKEPAKEPAKKPAKKGC